jgi:hypothetical protein
MPPRTVVTPTDLNRDFKVDLADPIAPVGVNTSEHFRRNPTTGKIEVEPEGLLAIGNLSDVDVETAAPTNNQVLAYDDTAENWAPKDTTDLITGAQIKSLYEGEAETNAFTDTEKAKLTALSLNDLFTDTLATLTANATLTYVPGGANSVLVNQYIRTRAEGYVFKVLDVAAVSPTITTAGGVKLLRVFTPAELNITSLTANFIDPSAPTVTVAGMFWVDNTTTPPNLKQRNNANDGWLNWGNPASYATKAQGDKADSALQSANISTDADFTVDTGKLPTRAAVKTLVDASQLFQSRAAAAVAQGTVVQNTRGKTAIISASVGSNNDSGNSTFFAEISADASTWFTVGAGSTASLINYFGATLVVPPAWYWRVRRNSGSNTAAAVTYLESY